MKINVLDKGWIELQDMMGNDLAIVNAARVSFLGDSKGDEQDEKLLNYLMKHRHTGPFEQAMFKFQINAPLLVWWQLVRHRTASLNLQSGRYTELNELYFPKEWRLQSENNKQGSEGVLEDEEQNKYFHSFLKRYYFYGMSLYQEALKAGIAKEQARLFLPGFAMYYTGIWTIDAHNLMHFLSLRLDNHAQWEIRQYAEAIYEIFSEKLPWTTKAFKTYRRTK